MIEASIKAVPDLIPWFLLLATLLGGGMLLAARLAGKPAGWPLSLGVFTAAAIAVTLLPSGGGAGVSGFCDTGSLLPALTSVSAWLNVLLFAPLGYCATKTFNRPATIAILLGLASAGVELIQAEGDFGRSCSVTDLAANSLGALLGVVLAWRRPRFKDSLWAAGTALAGGALVTAAFAYGITPDDAVAPQQRAERHAKAMEGSDAWIAHVLEEIFPGSEIQQQKEERYTDTQVKVTVTTDKGHLIATWPNKQLLQAWSSQMHSEPGGLTQKEIRKKGEAFAQHWFPASLKGSDVSLDIIGDEEPLYQLTFRRYRDGLMMPMRLDISVTGAGRVMGFTHRPVSDPVMPAPEVTEEEARAIVRDAHGEESAAVLLAQQVKGSWTPVWMVGTKNSDVFVDAVTGKVVTVD
ncbi:hypothetical protein GCM10010294_27610 [Streptomyces griseoloalbus]|uniref:VanZ family protein n=1 Tax=Streptomyces griseoloalbus TaxID=67303 RepID=UPI0018753143|nr:hypothetical protein GCM10010294_27610 [Streptomyces griseoloalbus]